VHPDQDDDRLRQGRPADPPAEFGVHSDGLRVDLAEVVDRKDLLVDSIRRGSYRAVAKNGDLEPPRPVEAVRVVGSSGA
jgi:hypothetical protein